MIGNLGNITLLHLAGKLGLIEQISADDVANAYRLLRSRQHRLRLDGAEKTRVDIEAEPTLVNARNAVLDLWRQIFKAPSHL